MDFRQERHIGDILKERNIEIIGADHATRYGITQVPNFILTKQDISVGAKLAYAMLLKYAWDNSRRLIYINTANPPRCFMVTNLRFWLSIDVRVSLRAAL